MLQPDHCFCSVGPVPIGNRQRLDDRRMHTRGSGAVEHDEVLADERPEPRPRVISQRRIPDVHIVHAGIDELERLEQQRHRPVLLDGRQPFAERPTPH
nr:hypothetical protein [Curtobacterium sp. ZW137]